MGKSLVIDQGNSMIKFAVFDRNREIILKEAVNFKQYSSLFKLVETYKIDRVIYSSTGAKDPEIIRWMERFDLHLLFTQEMEVPLMVEYKTISTLGLDRLANGSAAVCLFPGQNCLIIDVGTCITYDIIEAKGTYIGGAISPGPDLRSKSMNDYTERLPLIKVDQSVPEIGKSTEMSLKSGVFNGILFEIEGYISRLSSVYGQLTIILTGGYTSLFANHVKNPIFADSNFTLKGLNEILQLNAN